MQRESTVAWLIAAVAVVLAIGRGGTQGKAKELAEALSAAGLADATGQAPAVEADPCAARPEGVLRDFFAAAGPADLDGSRYSLRTLLVTIPDPIDSLLDHAFDRKLEAVQRALAAHRYAQDRFWLPWTHDREHASTPGDECRSRVPGAMLFRRTNASGEGGPRKSPYGLADGLKTDLLLVLLVGETPTSGVSKQALIAALDLIDHHLPDRDRIDLLAPSFSGSSFSLRQAIDSWERNYLHSFHFISGSATSPRNKEFLTAANGMMTFHATVLPDDVVLREIFGKTLRDKFKAKPGEIAQLSESSTAYGLGLAAKEGDLAPGLLLQFPLHISQLRAAAPDLAPGSSEEARAAGAAQAADRGSGPSAPTDVVPLMSRFSTRYDEIGLARVLGTLSAEQVRYVLISSTDIRDKLFIARKVHEYTPDVRMIVLQSDAMLADRRYRQFLNGTIVASTYPLDAANQAFTAARPANASPSERRLHFSTDGAEGDYNAAVAILNEQSRELDKDPPTPVPLIEYAAPLAGNSVAQRPPVWLSLIYDGQIVPLAVDELAAGADVADYVYTPPSASDPRPTVELGTPGGWKLAFAVFMLLFLGCAHSASRLPPDGARLPNRAMLAFAWLGCAIFGLPAPLELAVLRLPAGTSVQLSGADWFLLVCWELVVVAPVLWLLVEVHAVLFARHEAVAMPGAAAVGGGGIALGGPPAREGGALLQALRGSPGVALALAAVAGAFALGAVTWFILTFGAVETITAAQALVVFRRTTSGGSITHFLALLMLLLCFFSISMRNAVAGWKRIGTATHRPSATSVRSCWKAHPVLVVMFGLGLLATAVVGFRASTPENWVLDRVAGVAIVLAGWSVMLAVYGQLVGGGAMLSHLDRLATKHVLRAIDAFHKSHSDLSRGLRTQVATGIADIRTCELASAADRAYAKEWLFSSAWPSPERASANRGVEEQVPQPDALALEAAGSIGAFIAMLKWTVFPALVGNLVFLVALDLTPIQPHRLLVLLSWSYLLTTTAVLSRLLFSFNRDPVLAALAGRKRGLVAFDWSLVLRLAPVIVMLVLNLIAAQFPLQFGDMDVGIVQSILTTLK